jgi:hypothetical protein
MKQELNQVINFENKLKEKTLVIVLSVRRRQLTVDQRITYTEVQKEKIYAEEAKQKQIEAGKQGKEGEADNIDN